MAPTEPLSVLIVDDEPGMRLLIKRCLADRCTLTEAASGTDALAAGADAWALDLLITDEQMPDMPGHELARRLRLQNPDLRVLYLTGHADDLFASKEQMWEREAYLDKPFTADGLRQAVALLLFGRLGL